MLERSAPLQSLTARFSAYRTAAAPHVARAWATTKRRSAQGWAFAKRVASKIAVLSKRALVATLSVIEKTLLSPVGRERVHATAVFTLIFAFGVTSVDFLLTGGPELSPGARAAPYVAQANLISARSPQPMGELAFAAPIETAVQDGVIEDATVTPLSARAPEVIAAQATPAKAEVERPATPSEPAKAKDEA